MHERGTGREHSSTIKTSIYMIKKIFNKKYIKNKGSITTIDCNPIKSEKEY